MSPIDTSIRVHHSIRILVMVLSIVMTSVPVLGQGAGGVADPISLRSTVELLSRYTDLEPRQRVAIEAAHDRYLQSFERLREGEIREFMELARETEAGRSGSMPELAQLDEMFTEWAGVNRRVAALDTRLFEEIGAVLDAEQADALARVGRLRARERSLSSNGMLSLSVGAGIDTAFWKIEPTEEETIAVDDILRGYEAVMPRLVEDHSRASVGMVRAMVRSMNDGGFGALTREDMQDPQVVQDVMAAMAEAQRLAMQPMYEAQNAIEDRGLSAAKGFRSRIAPDRWHRMKRLWISAAFPGTGMGLTGGRELDVPRHAEAVRLEIAGDRDRVDSLEAILRNWYATDDRQTDDLIEFARNQSAQEFLDPMNVGNIRPDAVREVHEERRETAKRAVQALMNLVSDPAVRAGIEKRIEDGGSVIVQGGVEIPIQPRRADDPETREDRERISIARAAAGIPVPVSREDLTLFAWLMDLDEDGLAVMETAHGDYLEEWSDIVDPLIRQATSVGTRRDLSRPADPELIRNRGEFMKEALDAVLRADETFIDRIEITLADASRMDGLEAIRVQRIFDRIDSIKDGRFDSVFGMPVIEPVSPYRIIHEMDLDESSLENGRFALFGRNADLLTAVEGWEHARLESDTAHRIAIEPLAFGPDLPDDATMEEIMAASAASSQRYLELASEEASRRRTEADTRRGVIEAVVEESLIPDLPSLDGLRLRVEMFERGWGGVRRNHNGLETAVKVLRLKDLDDDQTLMVETLLGDHLESEAALIDDMAAQAVAEIDPDDLSRSLNQKFVFRRGELQERLIQKLLVILRPEQIAGIPALAERVD